MQQQHRQFTKNATKNEWRVLLALNNIGAKHAPSIIGVEPNTSGEKKSIKLTMEWVGESLLDVIKRNEALDWARLRRNLTVALTDIARVGYIHNDLAPGGSLRNITQAPDGKYYVIDYGKMIKRKSVGKKAIAQQVAAIIEDIRRLIQVHNRQYDPTRSQVTTTAPPPRRITLV
jgi:RIO-like serine/threonine protein kinase